MIVKDDNGNTLLKIIGVEEEKAEEAFVPITHCLAVVKVGAEYLLGWNKYRQDWEIFGGCRESNETLVECINRECREELGLENVDFSYVGLLYYYMAPGYFNPNWHYEYGGLYGVCLPAECMEAIEKNRTDREEIEKLAFYSRIKKKEKIALIDETLIEYGDNLIRV